VREGLHDEVAPSSRLTRTSRSDERRGHAERIVEASNRSVGLEPDRPRKERVAFGSAARIVRRNAVPAPGGSKLPIFDPRKRHKRSTHRTLLTRDSASPSSSSPDERSGQVRLTRQRARCSFESRPRHVHEMHARNPGCAPAGDERASFSPFPGRARRASTTGVMARGSRSNGRRANRRSVRVPRYHGNRQIASNSAIRARRRSYRDGSCRGVSDR